MIKVKCSEWTHHICGIQYIPRNMHTVFALLCFVVVMHWLIFPYPSGLLHWHCGNLTIAPVPAKQPWWIWINTSFELIMNDCITTTKQSTTKPCAYFLGYTVCANKPGCKYFTCRGDTKFVKKGSLKVDMISLGHPTSTDITRDTIVVLGLEVKCLHFIWRSSFRRSHP